MVGSRASDNANHFPLKLPFAPASVPFRKQFALRTVVPPYIYIYIYATSSWIQRTGKKRIRGWGSLRLSDEVNSECKGQRGGEGKQVRILFRVNRGTGSRFPVSRSQVVDIPIFLSIQRTGVIRFIAIYRFSHFFRYACREYNHPETHRPVKL